MRDLRGDPIGCRTSGSRGTPGAEPGPRGEPAAGSAPGKGAADSRADAAVHGAAPALACKWTWWAAVGAVVAYFGVQMAHTLLAINNWPFCSYDMFSRTTEARIRLWVALDASDGTTRLVRPGNVVPVEFFRAPNILVDTLLRSQDDARKRALCELLLARLNESGWPSFDETLPAARPPRGASFVGLRIVAIPLAGLCPAPVPDRAPQVVLYSHRR